MGQGEDHRSDIYSLGATLFHLLAGKPPIDVITGSYEELQKAKSKPAHLKPMAPHISPPTCRLVERMMAPDPGERPSAYDDLIAMIEDAHPTKKRRTKVTRIGGARVGSAGQRFLASQRARQGAQKKQRAALASVAALALVLGIGWSIFQAQQERNAAGGGSSTTGPSNLGDDETPLLGSDADALFARARQAVLEGHWEEALGHWETLAEREDASSELTQWALFHRGLTNILAGREPASREDFRRLGELSGEEGALNTLFANASHHLSKDTKVPRSIAEEANDGSCDAVALLAYGLKNWERGAFMEARRHLERFVELEPSREYPWITSYHPLIEDQLADLEWLSHRPKINSLKSKHALEEEQRALREFADTALTKRARGAANWRLKALGRRLEKWASSDGTHSGALPVARDREAWQTCQETLQSLASTMRFAEGKTFLQGQDRAFTTPAGQAHLADQLHAWQTADAFLDHLVAAAPGLTGSLKRLSAPPLSGTITGASRKSISIRTSAGIVTVPLSQVTPDSLARLAAKVLEETRDSNLYYRRQEELVLFAFLTGLERVLEEHARVLRQENRTFRERWDRLNAFKASISQDSQHG